MDKSCGTKPISRLRISDCGLPIGYRVAAGPPGWRRAKRAKQSQFASPRSPKPPVGWMAQNKANFPVPTTTRHPQPGQFCETKPISAEAAWWISTFWKSSYGELDRQETSAKQSQFSCGRQWATAGKGAGAPGRGNCAERTQFPSLAEEVGLPTPNLRRAERAKQTQSGRAGRRAGASQGRMCETNPIRARDAAPAGPTVQNKPISAREGDLMALECVTVPGYAPGGGTAGFLLMALRPRVTIVCERGLATEFMTEYRRTGPIAI